MTDANDTQTQINADASVRTSEEVEPWNGFLWKAVDWIVAFFPTYRDTREGRKTRRNMRIIFLVIGLGLLFAAGTAERGIFLWITLGILIAVLALVIPVEELKMRSWRSSLKKKQKPRTKFRWTDGRVDFDGQALEVYAGDDRVHRIRTSRGKHDLDVRSYDGDPVLGVLPPGAKKSQSIWIGSTGPVGADVDAGPQIGDDEMEHPASVDPNNWEQLWQALRSTD